MKSKYCLSPVKYRTYYLFYSSNCGQVILKMEPNKRPYYCCGSKIIRSSFFPNQATYTLGLSRGSPLPQHWYSYTSPSKSGSSSAGWLSVFYSLLPNPIHSTSRWHGNTVSVAGHWWNCTSTTATVGDSPKNSSVDMAPQYLKVDTEHWSATLKWISLQLLGIP